MTDIFQSRYYRINKFYLSSIGRWPYQSRRRRLSLLALEVCLGLSQIPPQIITAVKCWHEPEVIGELTPSFLATIAAAIRMICMAVNVDKLLQIFRRIEIDWISVAGKPEIHILRNYAETGRRITIGYTVTLCVVLGLFSIKPFIPGILKLINPTNETLPKMLPVPFDYYGLDVETHYYYLLLVMYISGINMLFVFTAADTMYFIHVQHACGKFAVVVHHLQCIGNYVTEEYVKYSHPKLDPAFRHLTLCIEKHRDAIEFSQLLEESYTWVLFSSLGAGMVSISYAGVKTVLAIAVDPKAAVRYVAFEIANVTIGFIFFFFAQRLTDHSQQIGEYLWQAEWYKTSLATQKLFNLLIMRTHVPYQFTVGKFMVLSLENYTSVLKTCFSYFTFMRSTQ